MKITVELPDALHRKAEAAAAEEGKSLKKYLAESVADCLRRRTSVPQIRPWETAFGGLRSLHRENVRIARLIAAEFEGVDEPGR